MARDATLIQVRERSYLDILDLTMVLVRSRPRPLFLAAVAGISPFVVLNAWLSAQYGLPLPLFVALLVMETPWATAPLTIVLGGMMFGDLPKPRNIVATVFRSLPALVVYQVIVRGVISATVFFYPFIPSQFAFLNEVILLERGRFWGTSKRTSALAGQRAIELFAQWLGDVVFSLLFIMSFWIGTSVILSSLTSTETTWERPDTTDLPGIRFQLAIWFAIAFFAVARFLTYIDQRIRLEGWEVKIRLQAVGRALELEGRW